MFYVLLEENLQSVDPSVDCNIFLKIILDFSIDSGYCKVKKKIVRMHNVMWKKRIKNMCLSV